MANSSFRGRVRDYDYIENADWVLAIVTNAGNDVQVSFRDPRFARILETALDLQIPVDVTYDSADNHLLAVNLETPPPPPPDSVVSMLAFEEQSGKCRTSVHVQGQLIQAFTRDVRCEGILATSLRAKKPVSYLTTVPDGTEMRITRVKINIP
jgi:hypothetical protein